ncbi:MAG: GAF domain-containing protein [Dehalococcoidales bacterium]
MPLSNLSLQKRISLLVLAGLVVGLGLFSWLGIQSLNESTERILEQRLTIARIMANQLDETLTHVLSHLQNIADSSDELPTGEEFRPLADSLRQIFAESGISVQNIILTDRNGQVLQVEPEETAIMGAEMSLYPEVKKTLETGLPTISNLIANPLMGTPVVMAAAPIFDKKGEIIGMLASSIDVERSAAATFSQSLQVGNTGYTEVVDGNGIVLTRTEPGSSPEIFEKSDHPGRFAELISEGKATVGTCHRCHETKEELQRRRDILAFAPLSSATWGVAIRQSEEEALAPTRQLEQRLFLLGILVLVGTLLLVWIMMQGIVKPIRMLTAAAKRVAAGDFKAAIPIRRKDEIGQLSTAFSTMTQELAQSRDELMARNEELAALNSIAATVSQSLNLEKVLENALQKVLEVTGSKTGCVFLRDANSSRLEMMTDIGSSLIFKCRESGLTTINCACHQVLHNRQTLMVNHFSQCPRLSDAAGKEDIDCFISVPLKSKDRTLGIMNVACSGERYFTQNDFRLLDSIGYHIGLAIENSILYEQAKQKEQLRGQLLSSVISAQEEERKRISRELHDEYGQTLTGAIMSMESVENMLPSGQSKLREKLESAKSLVVRALEDIRRLTLGLRPSTLDDLGLITTIRAYAHNHLQAMGVQVKFESKGLNNRLSPEVETALFRIIQEAIHNIEKHAEASNVSIHLSIDRDEITAIVEDDGRGFDVDAVFKSRIRTQSLGLLGIQERTALLGGTFSIKSKIGQGSHLEVKIPLTNSPPEGSVRARKAEAERNGKIQGL